MRIILISLILISLEILAACNSEQAQNIQLDSLANVFQSEGIVATFVAATVNGDTVYVHNETRSIERFSPASTFKIPNTLIALDVGAVTSISSTFKWDGTVRGIEGWNKDQTLETAFKVSCVWCYQILARKVGISHYESALVELDYGNQQTGQQVDSFWLNGDLAISAVEQISFLRKLYNRDLPFQRDHIEILMQIMVTQQTPQHTVYAKTGWAGTEPQVAWYVGIVDSRNGAWLFAMNMRVDSPEQAALREKLTVQSLQALGIM